jgi:hypothetical protein
MSTMTVLPPQTQIRRNLRWAISDGGWFRPKFFAEASWAAAWVVDETMRHHLAGQPVQLTVRLQDQLLGVLWDATSDVNEVLAATGWPTQEGDTLHLRATVISIIRDILVADDSPTDTPPAGISDPHTYALVCR